jgi:hypothetical protein
MGKALFAELVVFESPVIPQILAHVIADRPVVVISFQGFVRGHPCEWH